MALMSLRQLTHVVVAVLVLVVIARMGFHFRQITLREAESLLFKAAGKQPAKSATTSRRPPDIPDVIPTGGHVDTTFDAAKFEKLSHLYKVKDVDCLGVMKGDKAALENAKSKKKLKENSSHRANDRTYMEMTADCAKFTQDRGYVTSSMTELEAKFPLAYSIMTYRHIEALERLLRAVYRPQNFYCIHIDKKASKSFYDAVSAIAGCLDNVFMSSRRIDVRWGNFTVLEQELVCIEDLYKKSKDWKYFINLTGEEFPLKTNRELVEILTAYDGANDVEGVSMKRSGGQRRWGKYLPVPHNLTPVKGGVHVALNQDVVKFIVTDHRAKDLAEWLKPQFAPEETFFATIVHNPGLGLRGSFLGLNDVEEIMDRKPWFGRYKSWDDWPCADTRWNDVCILTVGDLPHLAASPFFFANKFYLHEDQVAYTCLEQRLFNTTRDLQLQRIVVNTTMYEQSVVVRQRMRLDDKGLEFHPAGVGSLFEYAKSRDKRTRDFYLKLIKDMGLQQKYDELHKQQEKQKHNVTSDKV